MLNEDAQQVADRLNQAAKILEGAAQRIRQYAQRASDGDAGDPSDGFGHHYLVDQSLREIGTIGINIPWGQAFDAAARADRPAEG